MVGLNDRLFGTSVLSKKNMYGTNGSPTLVLRQALNKCWNGWNFAFNHPHVCGAFRSSVGESLNSSLLVLPSLSEQNCELRGTELKSKDWNRACSVCTSSAKSNLLYRFSWNFLKLFTLQTLDTSYLVTFYLWILLFIIHRKFMKMMKIQAKIAKITDTESTLVQGCSGLGSTLGCRPGCLLHGSIFQLLRVFAENRFSSILENQ